MTKHKQLKKLKRRIKYLKLRIKNLEKKPFGITPKPVINNTDAYYKYMTQSVLLLLLKNKTIKVTNPIKFNDPMDSSIPDIKINCSQINKLIISALGDKYSEHLNEFKSEIDKEMTVEISKLKKELGVISEELREEWSKIISQFRILSLTTKGNNLLMWSHYADEHRGVVIQFKKDLSLGSPEKVDYFKGHQRLNNFFNAAFALIVKKEASTGFSDENTNDISNITLKVMFKYFFMKMSEWEYENEYRIVYEKNHPKIKNINNDLDVINIEEDDIECITIGSSVSPLRARRLKFLIKSRFPTVDIKHYYRVGWELKSRKLN